MPAVFARRNREGATKASGGASNLDTFGRSGTIKPTDTLRSGNVISTAVPNLAKSVLLKVGRSDMDRNNVAFCLACRFCVFDKHDFVFYNVGRNESPVNPCASATNKSTNPAQARCGTNIALVNTVRLVRLQKHAIVCSF